MRNMPTIRCSIKTATQRCVHVFVRRAVHARHAVHAVRAVFAAVAALAAGALGARLAFCAAGTPAGKAK